MKKTYYVFLIASIAIFALAIFFARGSFMVFFDPPSIMLTLAPTVLILLTVYSPREFGRSFKLAWKDNEGTRIAVKNSINFFKSARNLLLLMGIIGLMIGCILMLSAGWEAKKFAYGLSFALICMLYSFLLIFLVTIPFQNALENRLNEIEDQLR